MGGCAGRDWAPGAGALQWDVVRAAHRRCMARRGVERRHGKCHVVQAGGSRRVRRVPLGCYVGRCVEKEVPILWLRHKDMYNK